MCVSYVVFVSISFGVDERSQFDTLFSGISFKYGNLFMF